MNVPGEAIALAFALLIWIISLLIKFFRWAGKAINNVNTAPSPIQQAMAESQRQAETPGPSVRPLPPAPPRPQAMPPWEMPRQPQAGPSAVPFEATTQDFQRQERELLAEEPAPLGTPLNAFGTPFNTLGTPLNALGTPLRADATPPPPKDFRLFETDDDLLRAVILQQALGPPLCRQGR